MPRWTEYVREHLSVQYLSEDEQKNELVRHIQRHCGWPETQYMKTKNGKYVEDNTVLITDHLDDIVQKPVDHDFELHILPELDKIEKWMLVRIAVTMSLTFNKHVLCECVHRMQLWHQMLMRVCCSITNMVHIDESNLQLETKEMILQWRKNNLHLKIYYMTSHEQPRVGGGVWSLKECMIPTHSELESLFYILTKHYLSVVLQYVANSMHSKVPEKKLTLYRCSEICRGDIVLSRMTNTGTTIKKVVIDAAKRDSSENVKVSRIHEFSKKMKDRSREELEALAKTYQISVDLSNEMSMRQKMSELLEKKWVLLWGKKDTESQPNYLLCKVSMRVFEKYVSGVSSELLHGESKQKRKKSFKKSSQTRKMHKNRSRKVSKHSKASKDGKVRRTRDNDTEENTRTDESFGRSLSEAQEELTKLSKEVQDLRDKNDEDVNLEMKAPHTILSSAIPFCFRISVTTYYDAMQRPAVLDHHTPEHVHSTITSGPFPNERNYAGHVYLFDVVVLPNEYNGRQFSKNDHWMVGMDLYSRMIFACKSQGTTSIEMSSALARCLNKMNCTKFKTEAAKITNTNLPPKVIDEKVSFRDLDDIFLPSKKKIRNIDTNVFGLSASSASSDNYKSLWKEGDTPDNSYHIPPGYALEEKFCQSHLPKELDYTEAQVNVASERETRDHAVRSFGVIDEIFKTIVKFHSKNTNFQKQYRDIKNKFESITSGLISQTVKLDEASILQKLNEMHENAIENITVSQLSTVLHSNLDYFDTKLKDDHVITHDILLHLKIELSKIKDLGDSNWEDVCRVLSKIMKIDTGTKEMKSIVGVLKKLTFAKSVDVQTVFVKEEDKDKLCVILSQMKGIDPEFVNVVLNVSKGEETLRKSIHRQKALQSTDIPNLCTYVFTDSSTTDFGFRSTEVIVELGYKHVVVNKSSVDDETHRSNPLIMSPIESQFKQIRIMQLLKVKRNTIFNRNGGSVKYDYNPQNFVHFGNSGYLPDTQMQITDAQMQINGFHHISAQDIEYIVKKRNEGVYKSTGHAPVDLWKKMNYYVPPIAHKYVDFGKYPVGTVVDMKLVGEHDQGPHPANRRVSQLCIVKHNTYSMEVTAPCKDSSRLKFAITGKRTLYPGSIEQDLTIANTSVTPKQIERVIVARAINAKMQRLKMCLVNETLSILDGEWRDLHVQWLVSPILPNIPKEDEGAIFEIFDTYFVVKANSGVHVLENPPLSFKQVTGSAERPRWRII